MATQEASLKGCLPIFAFAAILMIPLYMVWRAQSTGDEVFNAQAGPYLDALTAGDWALAASVDHPDRQLSEADLAAAWIDRESRFGDLTSWTIHVANPGHDSDGEFIRAKVFLAFSELVGPAAVSFTLRADETGAMTVLESSSAPKTLQNEKIW